MPFKTPPESSWCRPCLIMLQGSILQLKQGASIMEVGRRTWVQSFHFRKRFKNGTWEIPKRSHTNFPALNCASFCTFSFHSTSSRSLIHDFVNCAEYQNFSMYSSTWRFHPTSKRHVHGCGVISVANAGFLSRKKKVCTSQLRSMFNPSRGHLPVLT
jgi:hypothetical protein